MNIRLEEISKEFNGQYAVKGLTLDISDGDLVSILGPSGCGKSTSLFLIAGLQEPSSGRILFNEKDVTSLDPKDREIGMVFQNYALYPHLTVFENIAFPLKMQKKKKEVIKKEVDDMARLNRIYDLLSRKPSELSGGQQQRVAIARALVKKPKILLLDEPLSNLDARLRIEMREEIRRIQQEVGITTIFVTHDQEEAMSISDKILLMKDGTLQQYTSPRNMYLNPQNKFVAKFLGNPSINFIEGKLIDNYFVSEDNYIKLKLEESLNHENLDTIGIRPEDLKLADKKDYDLEGIVGSIQTMGKEIYVKLELGRENEIIFITSWDYDLKLGSKVYLKIKKMYYF